MSVIIVIIFNQPTLKWIWNGYDVSEESPKPDRWSRRRIPGPMFWLVKPHQPMNYISKFVGVVKQVSTINRPLCSSQLFPRFASRDRSCHLPQTADLRMLFEKWSKTINRATLRSLESIKKTESLTSQKRGSNAKSSTADSHSNRSTD